MEISLSEDYRISSDSYQFILQERKVTAEGENKGNEYWTSIAYYRKLEHLLERYIDLKIRTSDKKSIKELMDYIRELKKEVREIVGC